MKSKRSKIEKYTFSQLNRLTGLKNTRVMFNLFGDTDDDLRIVDKFIVVEGGQWEFDGDCEHRKTGEYYWNVVDRYTHTFPFEEVDKLFIVKKIDVK